MHAQVRRGSRSSRRDCRSPRDRAVDLRDLFDRRCDCGGQKGGGSFAGQMVAERANLPGDAAITSTPCEPLTWRSMKPGTM